MARNLMLPLVLLLAGCAGKPTTYLALAPVPPVQPRQAVGLPPLAVATIDIPPTIDRLQLTTGDAPGPLHVAGNVEYRTTVGRRYSAGRDQFCGPGTPRDESEHIIEFDNY